MLNIQITFCIRKEKPLTGCSNNLYATGLTFFSYSEYFIMAEPVIPDSRATIIPVT